MALHEALDIGGGHGIDELDLIGEQRRQAHRVLALGFADNFVQVGKVIPLGIGLPVVLEAHQPGLVVARPGHELERARGDGVFGRRVKGVGRHHARRVVHDARRHGHIRQRRVDAYRIAVDDLDTVDGVHRAALPLAADFGVFDALEVQLHGLSVDFAAVVKQHPLAQPEHPGLEVFAGLPALGNTRNDVALVIQIGQTSIHQGSQMGAVKLIMPMPVEAGRIAARAVPQDTAPLRMLLGGGRRIGEAKCGHAGERPTGGDKEIPS